MFIAWAVIAELIVLLYVAYIFAMRHYWCRIKPHSLSTHKANSTTVSVLIPFRNEAENLPVLLNCLNQQNYPESLCQIIFINDHSEDGGDDLIAKSVALRPNFSLIHLEEETGKKAALRKGIASSGAELIVTIDADVLLHKNWLTHLVSFYEEKQYDMIVLPVMLKPANRFFQKLQSVDFLSLSGMTGASVEKGSPLMCNGANLCFRRRAFEEVSSQINHQHISSGDDMFLMLSMKESKDKKISYLFHVETVAHTNPCVSLKAFLSQRIRWVSKARFMSDAHIFLSGAVVLFANMAVLMLLILSFFNPAFIGHFLTVFIIKAVTDYFFLMSVARAFKMKVTLFEIIVLSLIYPFYALLIPVAGILYKPKWKGRTISLRTR